MPTSATNLPERSPTLASEARVFLKTVGGGQSEHTGKTYASGLTYFTTYLHETCEWESHTPIANLSPEMFQEFPVWLFKQSYRRSKRAAPVALAESTRSLYILAVTRFWGYWWGQL